MINYAFPVAFMANMLSMTAMLIILSVVGQSHLAADVGIVQAATSALFFAFSANARNLVLATSTPALAKSIFNIRVILLSPLVLVAFWLSSTLGGVEPVLASILILRRAVEWFAEVDLSERERTGDKNFALIYIFIQVLLFVIGFLWLLVKMPYPYFGIFLWAFLPLILSIKFSWFALGDFANVTSSITKRIAPHFGSSLAVGVSLYVFRLLLIMLLGKSVSGDLFAAFAIGGVLGSVFLNAFGPSVAFHEKTKGNFRLPRLLIFMFWNFSALGILIVSLSYITPSIFWGYGKEIFYWQTIGFSMIGGVIMTYAQLLRSRLLIHNENHDLFGPDLLMNMLVVAAVPLAYFTIGIGAVAGLSLLGAVMALAFYKSSEITEIIEIKSRISMLKYVQVILAVAMIIPIFITLGGGIFLTKEIALPLGTPLLSMPIPPSLFVIYFGILLIGSYRSVHLSLSVVFFSFILMIFSTLVVSKSQGLVEREKILLIIQYILPMIALVLGEMFKTEGLDSGARIEKAFLFVLLMFVPLELVASWLQGSLPLVGHLYVFSIYQHMQYVPNIFVSAYLLAIFSLWQDDKYRVALVIMSLLMGVYVAASLSLVTMTYLIAGVLVFAILRWRWASEMRPWYLFFAVLVICLGYSNVETINMAATSRFCFQSATSQFCFLDLNVLSNWQNYLGEIGSSIKSLLLGRAEGIDKSRFTSGANYYLDIIRNFGLIAVLPVLLLVGYTVRLTYMTRKSFLESPSLLGHLFVIVFLLAVDNSTQVSLRQPYSGVFSFFIWGLFIARLSNTEAIRIKLAAIDSIKRAGLRMQL